LNCKICHRKPVKDGFCPLHLKAYENIVKNYEVWKKAAELSWKEYLSEVEKNSLTGEWAKEVAKYLINNEGTTSVAEN
jgi:hypothetical protein